MATKKINCVDLTLELAKGEMKNFDSRKGVLVRLGEYLYAFYEHGVKVVRQQWKCWVELAKSMFGTAKLNSDHVRVMMYIPHSSYGSDVNKLSDIIKDEAKVLADQLKESPVVEWAESLQEMKIRYEESAE